MTIPRASTGAHTPAAQSGTAPLVRSCPDERLALGTALPASRGHRGASHMPFRGPLASPKPRMIPSLPARYSARQRPRASLPSNPIVPPTGLA